MPYQHHPSAGELPDRQIPIWRFLGLAKFFSLLTSSSLYFSQVLQLKKSDPYEGSLTLLNREFREAMIRDEGFARTFLQLPPDHPLPSNYREIWCPEREKVFRQIFSAITYVNCWHMSAHESAFLWSNYASLTDGIAIRSTIGRLCDSVSSEPRPIYVGPVRYIDYRKEGIREDNVFNAFFCKRKSFDPERELRACFSHLTEGVGLSAKSITANPTGIAIPCSISALVDEVIVSPFAPDWSLDVVSNVCRAIGHDLRLTKSSISDPAIL